MTLLGHDFGKTDNFRLFALLSRLVLQFIIRFDGSADGLAWQ
jgi:hypothetical protein